MAKQKRQSSKQSQGDDWVMVDMKVSTKTHTKSRHPQYNGDNEPSGRKANDSTAATRIGSSTFDDFETFGQDGYSIATTQKTDSNPSSTDTGTSTSTATLADRDDTTPPYYSSPTSFYPSGTLLGFGPTSPALTESTLQQYQQELEYQAVMNLPGWIAHSGIAYRFAKYPASSTHESMVVGSSMTSTTNSSRGWYSGPPPSVGVDDIVAAGAWCDPPIEALVQGSSQYMGLGPE